MSLIFLHPVKLLLTAWKGLHCSKLKAQSLPAKEQPKPLSKSKPRRRHTAFFELP